MTNKQIKDLILTGEGYHIEFKQTLDKTLIEEVCAFANSSGGDILMGIADDGTIKGIDISNRFRSKIQDLLNRLQPKLDIDVEIKKNLIVIHVPEGKEKPYASSRGFFMRVGANSQKMTRQEIISFFKKEGRINFEELINEKADFKHDFNLEAFNNFLKISGISPTINHETLLQNLDCLTADKKLTNLGVLFFAKDIDFIMNHALVDCVLFSGTSKVKILDRKQYKSHIIENIESALAFIQRHTNTEYVITGQPRREEIHDYPETALRETIVNAVCHRDYFEKRCHVVIEVFADRVEIYNPGGLPSGLEPEKFGTKSVPRNLLIASMLHRANYIEQAGTGINRIKEALAKHKRKVKLDIKYSKNSLFYSVIFKKKVRAETAKSSSKVENTSPSVKDTVALKPQKNPLVVSTKVSLKFGINADEFRSIFGISIDKFRSIFGIKVLKTAWLIHKHQGISSKQISEKLSITKRTAENYLSKLKQAKHIVRVGSNKTGHWKIKNSLPRVKDTVALNLQKSQSETSSKVSLKFGINADEFRSIFGINVEKFRSIFGIKVLKTAWLIHKHQGISSKQISEKLSITKRTAENYLSKLKQAKHIVRVGSNKTGYWKIKNLSASVKDTVALNLQKSQSATSSKISLKFGINADEFRSIFGINVEKFRSIFGIKVLKTAWLIHKHQGISSKQISEKLSITKRTAENYLSKLKQAKHIVRVGSNKTGYWKIKNLSPSVKDTRTLKTQKSPLVVQIRPH